MSFGFFISNIYRTPMFTLHNFVQLFKLLHFEKSRIKSDLIFLYKLLNNCIDRIVIND